MSERKVLNKYFPPDFDPSKIPRRRMPKDAQQTVRLMAPCTLCCLTCGEFIYKGKKFNAKKETAQGEEYYGIKIFRFYIKCTRCSAEITFKTDPKNADYTVEHGATRNYEPWREAPPIPNASADDEEANKSEEEDPMDALEASQAASKQQMEDEDDLADLRQRNARVSKSDMDPEAILALHHAQSVEEAEKVRKEQEEDDEIVRKHFYKIQEGGKGEGKGKEVAGLGGLDYASSEDEGEAEGAGGEVPGPNNVQTITVKRKLIPDKEEVEYQPTVEELLVMKGKKVEIPVFLKPGLPASAMRSLGSGSGSGKANVTGGDVGKMLTSRNGTGGVKRKIWLALWGSKLERRKSFRRW